MKPLKRVRDTLAARRTEWANAVAAWPIYRKMRQNAQSRPLTETMPVPPWRVERVGTHFIAAEIPPGPAGTRITPTAYRAGGPDNFDWPMRDGSASFGLTLARAAHVTVLPRSLYLNVHGELMVRTFGPTHRHHDALRQLPFGHHMPTQIIQPMEIEQIDEPVFVADSAWPGVYGHLLLEVLPALMLRPYAARDTMVLTSAPLGRTAKLMLEQFGVPASRVRRIEGPVRCAEVWLPDRPVRLGTGIHPLAWSAFSRIKAIGARSTAETPQRIFISRSGVNARRLSNETEVEAMFARYGFVVIHPERLPIEDQIAIFANARMISGLGGSGMHNIVFAAPETPMLVVQSRQRAPRVDMMLAGAERRLGYVFGSSEPGRGPYTAPWTVDIADVEAGIRGHFDL